VAAQLDLFGEERVARRAILWALVRIVRLIGCGQFLSRNERFRIGHKTSQGLLLFYRYVGADGTFSTSPTRSHDYSLFCI
jgi:hypothetical protein